jgi:hypothetical protein
LRGAHAATSCRTLMAAPILTKAAQIMCPHGGQCMVVPQNMMVQIAGSPVLVMTDIFPIVGCVFNIAGAPAPCIMVQWTMPALSVMVNNSPALLQSSIGLCTGGSGALPAVVIPGQFTVLGS